MGKPYKAIPSSNAGREGQKVIQGWVSLTGRIYNPNQSNHGYWPQIWILNYEEFLCRISMIYIIFY